MNAKPLRIAIGIVVASLAVSATAHAQRPSALVLETVGPSTPKVDPYSEIPAGTTIALGAGSKLVFLHYYTCRTVSAVGGKLTVDAEQYGVVGGSTSEQRTPCPHKINLKRGEAGGVVITSKPSGETAGLMVRGIGRLPEEPARVAILLSTQPAFVLVGARAGEVAAVRISQGAATVLEAPLVDRAFRWPAGTAPLAPGADYELTLSLKDAAAMTWSVKFTTESAPTAPSAAALVLITVE